MTKETKVGLVIGLLFMVGVVYLLSVVTRPSDLEKQVGEYRAQQRAAKEEDLRALGNRHISLSVANKTKPLEQKVKTAVDILAQKKDVPGPAMKLPVVKKTIVAPPPKVQFYIVKAGQTLSDVAEDVYGAAGRQEWRRIHEANKYKVPNAHIIWPGLKLRIPSLAKPKPTDAKRVLSLGGVRSYMVMPGDTLSEISSKKLGTATRWREILALNRDKLPNEFALRPGMVLKLPAAVSKGSLLRRLPEGPEDIWR